MNILFFGDIFGKPGRIAINRTLPEMIEEFDAEICIANGENVAAGKGITEKTAGQLFDAGIDIFTSGNHIWDKLDSLNLHKKGSCINCLFFIFLFIFD